MEGGGCVDGELARLRVDWRVVWKGRVKADVSCRGRL